jgi:hypothetical protein
MRRGHGTAGPIVFVSLPGQTLAINGQHAPDGVMLGWCGVKQDAPAVTIRTIASLSTVDGADELYGDNWMTSFPRSGTGPASIAIGELRVSRHAQRETCSASARVLQPRSRGAVLGAVAGDPAPTWAAR